MDISLNPEIFNEVYLPYFDKPQRHQIIFGGSSSGKSYQMFAYAIFWMLQGRSIIVARKTAKSMRKSVWLELNKAIYRYKLQDYIKVHKTDMVFESLVGNGSITLVGLDDSERLKSLTPLKADAFDTCMVEEATEISEMDYQQLLIRQRGISEFPKRMILLFNPVFRQHWIYKMFFEGIWLDTDKHFEDEKITILKTTYKDNKFLGEEEKQTLENLRITSPYHYEVYCLGNFGVLGNKVFNNWEIHDFEWDSKLLEFLEIKIGLDFGYVNDPTAIILSKHDPVNKIIYIYHIDYGYEWTNDKIYDKLKKTLYDKARLTTSIYADSAEPKSIKDLYSKGLNVIPAKKGKDSIRKGIDYLLQHKIIVHPSCNEIIEEFNQYTWKERDGVPTNEPINKYNHCIDALRYSYSREAAAGGKIIFTRIGI